MGLYGIRPCFRACYKTLSTTQPAYLHNLISVQPPGRTRSSFLIIIARSPSSSSLKITNRSFRYASPSLWNNLPASFRQPRSSSVTTITPSITSSLFRSRLKTHLIQKSFWPYPTYRTAQWTSTGLPSRIPYTTQRYVLVLSLGPLLLIDACVGLNWLSASFWSHGNKITFIHSFIHSFMRGFQIHT